MRNKMMILLAGGMGLAMATPAAAQTEAAPFDGFYVGGSLGYDFQPKGGNDTIAFDRNLDGTFGDTVTLAAPQANGNSNAFAPGFCRGRATAATAANGCRPNKDGTGYAARIGLDKQFGAIVVGAVGEFGKSEIRDSVTAFSTTPAFYTMTRAVDYDASARLRLGFAASNTLFYGTGGVAYAKVDHSFETSNAANTFSASGKNDAWGYVLGGGVEQKVGRNFSVGLEYQYKTLKDDDYTVRAGAGATTPVTNPFVLGNAQGTDFQRSDDRLKSHSVRAVAAFRF
ncbi:outer membrane protein [Sphingomonas qilianensis]|uniref:Outer membrane beta-barrel protein n=1 Tax=Sphingomonas qilianensis TaxID=1736690 RepID=A0ABU9XPX3_9SPHN